MSDYNRNPDLADMLTTMQRRIEALERTVSGSLIAPPYTTAGRPSAIGRDGAIIFNTTTGKHEGSNGTTWTAFT
jgi:hypothetical protein